MNFGFYSYSAAAIAYGFFTLLLMFSWQQSKPAKLLTIVMLVSTLWAVAAANLSFGDANSLSWQVYQILEIGRNIAWLVFLIKLFEPVNKPLTLTPNLADSSSSVGSKSGLQLADKSPRSESEKFIRWSLPLSIGFAGMLLSNELLQLIQGAVVNIIGHIFLALFGVVVLEQVFRNSSVKYRWAIKYLIIGAGSIFIFDFYFYTDALLYHGLERPLWQARGIINLVAVPLLAISAARSKNWSLNLFVSRDVVINSTAVFGGGLYLLFMAGAGYYLKEFGGGWGRLSQIVLFSLALIFLIAVLLSGQLRARVRVFLGKNFYKNRYDYRLEWLRLTDDLSLHLQHGNHYLVAIESMAKIIDARAGMLWLATDTVSQVEQFTNVASWQCVQLDAIAQDNDSLMRFIAGTRYVINIHDLLNRPEEYSGLVLPDWIGQVQAAWIIVPLLEIDRVLGFILLAQPLLERSINWEDRDLLKTAARQVASYLTVLKTSAALAEAKQFEVFTRLSAYMVHDLKNIATELELVAENAKRHSANPVFVEDAFETVEHAATDIKRLLEQLRSRRSRTEKKVLINLSTLISEVVEIKQAVMPQPVFEAACDDCIVAAEYSQMRNVLAHLIENAQQATANDGDVLVRLGKNNGSYVISIKDTGHGMDENFIRQRLFKPFDTTKGNAGMGIGMYESRDFVRRLGGDIQVRSKPEKGSIISLHLPVINDNMV